MKITAVKGFAVQGGVRNQFVVKIETDEGIVVRPDERLRPSAA